MHRNQFERREKWLRLSSSSKLLMINWKIAIVLFTKVVITFWLYLREFFLVSIGIRKQVTELVWHFVGFLKAFDWKFWSKWRQSLTTPQLLIKFSSIHYRILCSLLCISASLASDAETLEVTRKSTQSTSTETSVKVDTESAEICETRINSVVLLAYEIYSLKTGHTLPKSIVLQSY